MFDKDKYKGIALGVADAVREKPIETLFAVATVIGIAAKTVSTVTEAQNAATWKREVKRRERNQKNI